MAGERYLTTNHERIRKWAEERNGKPSTVASTHQEDDAGIIRLDFPGYSGGDSLEEISWDEWLKKFDESDLVLLHQETTSDGEQSNFNKLIKRETAEDAEKNAVWVDQREEALRAAARSSSGSGRSDGKVNLNEASAEELDSVFGIGPATAKRIIAYRDKELGGRFHDVHDITHIDGIGEKTAELITENAVLD